MASDTPEDQGDEQGGLGDASSVESHTADPGVLPSTPFQSASSSSGGVDPRDAIRAEILRDTISQSGELPVAGTLASGVDEQATSLRQRHEIDRRKTELGLFGKLIGGEGVSSTHVAFTVIIASFAIILFLYVESFWRGNLGQVSSEIKALIGLITSALSFIFGRASKKSAD